MQRTLEELGIEPERVQMYNLSSSMGPRFAEIATEVTTQTAESYAVLIIKYFPGGIFALLDRYKEELAATTATFVLIRAVSEAKAKKAEEDAKEEESKTTENTVANTGVAQRDKTDG